MWNYLYFLHHLQLKPQDDFTGQESYVWDAQGGVAQGTNRPARKPIPSVRRK